jgi:glucan phosphoethanolaminetransferase (alkaline phosphatase superfamily)
MVEPENIVEIVIAVFLGAVIVLSFWNAVFDLEISGLINSLVDSFVIALMIAVGAAIFFSIIQVVLD